MVGVAQLVEHLVVVQVVAGSSPVTHPRSEGPRTWCGALRASTRSRPVRVDASAAAEATHRRHVATDDRGIPTGSARAEPAESAAPAARAFDDRSDGPEPGARFTVPGTGRALTVLLVAGYPAGPTLLPA